MSDEPVVVAQKMPLKRGEQFRYVFIRITGAKGENVRVVIYNRDTNKYQFPLANTIEPDDERLVQFSSLVDAQHFARLLGNVAPVSFQTAKRYLKGDD